MSFRDKDSEREACLRHAARSLLPRSGTPTVWQLLETLRKRLERVRERRKPPSRDESALFLET
ncbi:MAG: hypothetical protein V7K89_33930 [Nostoc sp.]|uniref:hypothetical protein n=1 Tax=Nostoc sp. TaxID=1180 RepID=UPI002FF9A88D